MKLFVIFMVAIVVRGVRQPQTKAKRFPKLSPHVYYE